MHKLENIELLLDELNIFIHGHDRSRLPSLQASETNLASFRQRLIQGYLEGQIVIRHFYENYPDLYDMIVRIKGAREGLLEIESLTSTSPSDQRLQQQFKQLEHELRTSIPAASAPNVANLVLEAVADWMMRCPLDFPSK